MNKTLLIVRWVVVILLALLFLSSGYPKIFPNESMVKRFNAWEYNEWFLKLIGIIELLGGTFLLIPKFSFYATVLLMMVMVGAIYTHLSTGVGSPFFAGIVLILLSIVSYLFFRNSKKKIEIE